MASHGRQRTTGTITYSRKTTAKTITNSPARPGRPQHGRATDESKRSFWDFDESSEEEQNERTVATRTNVCDEIQDTTKRKATESMDDRVTKTLMTVESPVIQRRENLESAKAMTPRKSNFAVKPNNSLSSPDRSRQQTSRLQTQSPCPATPRSKPASTPSTPPRPSPKPWITPTKRPISRGVSSTLSTPPSFHKSHSQPNFSSPSLKPRSRTFRDYPSAKMTPKQAKIWEYLNVHEDSSPSRRRLVDKLRDEAARSPERIKTPSPAVTQSQPIVQSFNLDYEISQILDYTPPFVVDEQPRSQARKESQSDSQGTYLSRSRTFLADTSMQDPLSVEEFWHADFEEQQPKDMVVEEEDPGVRSWHELKRGGQDKRLLDEMEDLIDQCKAGGRLGLRRSSVLQIVENLCGDVEWGRKFTGLGLMSMFIDVVADADADPILLTLTLLAVDLVPKPVPPTMSAEILKLCLAGLKEGRSLGTLSALKSMNVSKILKSELSALETKIAKTKGSAGIINAQRLAFDVVIDLRVFDIRPVCSFLSEIEGDYHWTMLVSVAGSLEKSTQGRLMPTLTRQSIHPFNPILQAGLQDFESNCVLRKATLSFLRVCINLTNSCGEICEYLDPDLELSTILASVIASDPQRYSNADYRRESDSDSDHLPSAHEAKHEERESRFEVLLLSLGLMINFVQESDTVKDLILSSPIPNGIIHIFEKLVCRDEPANHALGYLALLLAHLMIPSRAGKVISVKLDMRERVVKLLDELVGISRVVQSQSQEEGERKDVEGMAGEVERVLIQLRAQDFRYR